MEIPNILLPTYLIRMCLVAATSLILMTSPLHANPVLPGNTVTPDVFTVSGSPTFLNQTGGSFNFAGGALTGVYSEVVLVDPFGITCSGCLDFAFQVELDEPSPSSINQLVMASFFGRSADVGYAVGFGGGVMLV